MSNDLQHLVTLLDTLDKRVESDSLSNEEAELINQIRKKTLAIRAKDVYHSRVRKVPVKTLGSKWGVTHSRCTKIYYDYKIKQDARKHPVSVD